MSKDNIEYKAFLSTLVAIMVIAILSGCTILDIDTPRQVTDQTAVTVVTQRYASIASVSSYPELAYRSDMILIGSPVAVGETINIARDVDDLSKPDSDLFGIGRIYEVEVELYIKGSGEKVIQVVQSQGHLNTESGPPSAAEIEQASADDKHIPLRIGARYLMFLVPTYGFSEGQFYSGIYQPWRFFVDSDDCVYSESLMGDLTSYFPPQPLKSVLKELEKPYDPSSVKGGLPYPLPLTSDVCSPQPKSGPYPPP